MESEELEFYTEWLSLDKYHFKILTMITVLADNKRAFRGKISDLCKKLSIQASAANTGKIKTALKLLAESGYINVIIDKDIYTVTLTKAAEKADNVRKIKREWYKIIRQADSEAAWEQLLKVFLYLIGLPQGKDTILTYRQIGESLNCSVSTVERAIKTICNLSFGDMVFKKNVIKEKMENDFTITLGTAFTQGINFE